MIVSTLRIASFHLLDGGRQVVCLPGTTLYQLERALKPRGREPHSVIGSSCIGASVVGGVCNNSGGALIRRGPSYTRMALYARIDETGGLRLVNHLGIDLGDDPETILDRLDRGRFAPADVSPGAAASDGDYAAHVRDVEAASPARFNADPRRLFEASGSAGKVIVFAVRLDTFPIEQDTRTYYIGANRPAVLTALRRDFLIGIGTLPIAGEYIHRTAFDIAAVYGKDLFLAVRWLGTDRLPALFALKARFDAIAGRLLPGRAGAGDRLLQRLSRLLPDHLPRRMRAFRERYEHHLILKMPADGVPEAEAYLARHFPLADGDWFACDAGEASRAFLHRFAVAGAAVRYRAVHPETVEDIVALDVALPRNCSDWFEDLPGDLGASIVHELHYGHFFCHVFHQDYVIAKGRDVAAIEHAMYGRLDARGAEYPAEHNVGHRYAAKPPLAAFYRSLDPRNQLNPGIGRASKRRFWSGHGA